MELNSSRLQIMDKGSVSYRMLQPSAFLTDITALCSMVFYVCLFLWYFNDHQKEHRYFMGSQGIGESTRFF